MDSRRQHRVANLIKEELGALFLKEGRNFYGSSFVTITDVAITPDLAVARIYLSLFKEEKPDLLIDRINAQSWDIRKRIGQRIRHQLRQNPELEFYLDSSLDKVDRLDDLFKEIDDNTDQGDADAS